MSKPNHVNRPYMFRWLFTVQDDTALSRNAKTAAVPIFRHAHMTTGKGCYVGAETAARETGASRSTIQRGWQELAEAGYLNVWQPNRGSGKGADRWARFPGKVSVPEKRSERPGDAVEAERSAEETSPHSSGSASRRIDRDVEIGTPGSGRDETTRGPGGREGADGATDADSQLCVTCGERPTRSKWYSECDQCIAASEKARPQPPIGHRDDQELRNA
jgi:hypothetical protein